MTDNATKTLRDAFRRQMRLADQLCVLLAAMMLGGLVAQAVLTGSTRQWVAFGMLAVVGACIAFWLRAVRQIRSTQAGSAMLAAGHAKEASEALQRTITTFSPVRSVKILALHQLTVVAYMERSYRRAVELCRELLSTRLGTMQSLATSARLMLADSLLMLGHDEGAGKVIRELNAEALSLTERLTLLPVETRFLLRTNQPAAAVEGLAEKLQLADLLDGRDAALMHLLLAQACRLMDMPRRQRYLTARAGLLADIEPIVEQHKDVLGDVDWSAGIDSDAETGKKESD